MNDIPDDLQGDPHRRASDAVRGFLYQFWRTVEAWIALAPEDVLFVEGAEDFDRLGEHEGTAFQVKTSAGVQARPPASTVDAIAT